MILKYRQFLSAGWWTIKLLRFLTTSQEVNAGMMVPMEFGVVCNELTVRVLVLLVTSVSCWRSLTFRPSKTLWPAPLVAWMTSVSLPSLASFWHWLDREVDKRQFRVTPRQQRPLCRPGCQGRPLGWDQTRSWETKDVAVLMLYRLVVHRHHHHDRATLCAAEQTRPRVELFTF